jgi:hypothetical protein
MSQANVKIVKRGIVAFNQRDPDRFAKLATDDFVWFPALPGAVEAGSYHGREVALRGFLPLRGSGVE